MRSQGGRSERELRVCVENQPSLLLMLLPNTKKSSLPNKVSHLMYRRRQCWVPNAAEFIRRENSRRFRFGISCFFWFIIRLDIVFCKLSAMAGIAKNFNKSQIKLNYQSAKTDQKKNPRGNLRLWFEQSSLWRGINGSWVMINFSASTIKDSSSPS